MDLVFVSDYGQTLFKCYLKWEIHKTGKLYLQCLLIVILESLQSTLNIYSSSQRNSDKYCPHFPVEKSSLQRFSPNYIAHKCQSQVLQSFSLKIDDESHFILKVVKEIFALGIDSFYVLALALASFQTVSLNCAHYSPCEFLGRKKIEAWNFWDLTNWV